MPSATTASKVDVNLVDTLRDGFTSARNRLTDLVEEVEQRIPDASRRALDDIVERARQTRGEIGRRVDESLDRTLGAFNIPTRHQVDALDKKVADLAKRVSALQHGGNGRGRTTAARATSRRAPSSKRSRAA